MHHNTFWSWLEEAIITLFLLLLVGMAKHGCEADMGRRQRKPYQLTMAALLPLPIAATSNATRIGANVKVNTTTAVVDTKTNRNGKLLLELADQPT
jgi:hypothetical protein